MENTREFFNGYGYDSMVWVRDDKGHELSCTLDSIRKVDSIGDLSEHERQSCSDVNQLIGTERW